MPQWHFPTSSRDPRSDAAGGPLSRRALFAATAIGVPAVAVVAGTLPAAADPSVTGGDTRIVDVPLSDAPIVDEDGLQARDLPGHLATMAGATWSAGATEPLVHARGLLEDGTWTEWFELETALDPETGDRAPGTELAWLGNGRMIESWSTRTSYLNYSRQPHNGYYTVKPTIKRPFV